MDIENGRPQRTGTAETPTPFRRNASHRFRPSGRTRLICCKLLKINDTGFRFGRAPMPGEHTRPRVWRSAPPPTASFPARNLNASALLPASLRSSRLFLIQGYLSIIKVFLQTMVHFIRTVGRKSKPRAVVGPRQSILAVAGTVENLPRGSCHFSAIG